MASRDDLSGMSSTNLFPNLSPNLNSVALITAVPWLGVPGGAAVVYEVVQLLSIARATSTPDVSNVCWRSSLPIRIFLVSLYQYACSSMTSFTCRTVSYIVASILVTWVTSTLISSILPVRSARPTFVLFTRCSILWNLPVSSYCLVALTCRMSWSSVRIEPRAAASISVEIGSPLGGKVEVWVGSAM